MSRNGGTTALAELVASEPDNPFYGKASESTMTKNMANLSVRAPSPDAAPMIRIEGPPPQPPSKESDKEKMEGTKYNAAVPPALSVGDVCCGQTISTYPMQTDGTRFGDPIADYFVAEVGDDRAVLVVADGCNWGARVAEAAKRAATAFADYLVAHLPSIKYTNECRKLLLDAVAAAHQAIFEDKEPVNGYYSCGMTTLLGGVILPIEPVDQFCPAFEFMCVSVGDCKAFIYTDNKMEDVTVYNRTNVTDASDCGGRLGPAADLPHAADVRNLADLGNLRLFAMPCDESDMLVLMSDGVHDNLDPQHLGKLPSDMPKSMGLGDAAEWKDCDKSAVDKSKDQFRAIYLEQKVRSCQLSPSAVVDCLTRHCVDTTTASRRFMIDNQGKKLPYDYSRFPGKLDHTTVLAFRIGNSVADEEEDDEFGMIGDDDDIDKEYQK